MTQCSSLYYYLLLLLVVLCEELYSAHLLVVRVERQILKFYFNRHNAVGFVIKGDQLSLPSWTDSSSHGLLLSVVFHAY